MVPKVRYRHSVELDNGNLIVIEPGGGSMADDEAEALAGTPWSKRLIVIAIITTPMCSFVESLAATKN